MKIIIFFYITHCFAGIDIDSGSTATTQQIICDPNASVQGGCYLQDYSGEWVTTKCSSGYILTSSMTCVAPCGSGYYLNGAECAACSDNCVSCFGPNNFQCLNCESTHSLNYQNICSLTCTNNNQFGLPSSTECRNCDASCASCLQTHKTTCLSCPSASDTLKVFAYAAGLTNSGYCIPNPSSTYSNFFRQYPGDSLVVQCPSGCSKCSDRFKCTECSPGFELYPPASVLAAYAMCYSTS
jgi:hypothetical protein